MSMHEKNVCRLALCDLGIAFEDITGNMNEASFCSQIYVEWSVLESTHCPLLVPRISFYGMH